MTLEELEKIFTNWKTKKEVVDLLQDSPDPIKILLDYTLSDRKNMWRAAWVAASLIGKNDGRYSAYVPKLIKRLSTAKGGFQREILQVLRRLKIDDDQQGYLFDACCGIWENLSNQSSVRITAFKFMIDVVNKYPELKDEVQYFTAKEYTKDLGHGIKRTFEKLLEKHNYLPRP